MPRAERAALRFVRALVAGDAARADVGGYVVAGRPELRLSVRETKILVASGVLEVVGEQCRAAGGARSWLKRNLIDEDQFAAQHREVVRTADGLAINLNESPLARLARPAKGEGEAFLSPSQVEAGERMRKLFERAQLQPRLTMAYSATHTLKSGGARGGAGDISDLAADARRQLAELTRLLPGDCAGVVMDVCGLGKGLQIVETERGWPRRSAKLVLRIGLEQLARHLGLDEHAVGPERGRHRKWLGDGARPTAFG